MKRYKKRYKRQDARYKKYSITNNQFSNSGIGFCFLVIICSLFLVSWSLAADAAAAPGRGLFGDIDGYFEVRNDGYQSISNGNVLTSRLKIWKEFTAKSLSFLPYYYYKNEAVNSPLYVGYGYVRNEIGLDTRVYQTDLTYFTVGIGYANMSWQPTGSDQIITTKGRVDF